MTEMHYRSSDGDWHETYGNVVAVARYLYEQEGWEAKEIVWFLEKPWKWREKWEAMNMANGNPMAVERPIDDPYLIFLSDDGWERRILKSYQKDDTKPHARWFSATRSPFTFGGWEYGDTYVSDTLGVPGWVDVTEERRVARKIAGETSESD